VAWSFTDRATFRAPIRRKAIDGSEYEASPMVIERNGVPWRTHFAGYRMGIVASDSNWLDSNLPKAPELSNWPKLPKSRDNFELAKLPYPFIEGEVVEYFKRDDLPTFPLFSRPERFAYATSREEQAALDATTLWERSGRTFKTGGYVSVCRIDGPAAYGVATQFFSANEGECQALQSAPGLISKGYSFRASTPRRTSAAVPNLCPAGTVGLYRFYKPNASSVSNRAVPNHRFVTLSDPENAADQMLFLGWINEGITLCVPQ
jgi:hypothetical protein